MTSSATKNGNNQIPAFTFLFYVATCLILVFNDRIVSGGTTSGNQNQATNDDTQPRIKLSTLKIINVYFPMTSAILVLLANLVAKSTSMDVDLPNSYVIYIVPALINPMFLIILIDDKNARKWVKLRLRQIFNASQIGPLMPGNQDDQNPHPAHAQDQQEHVNHGDVIVSEL